jgi:hypothetical protein
MQSERVPLWRFQYFKSAHPSTVLALVVAQQGTRMSMAATALELGEQRPSCGLTNTFRLIPFAAPTES